eukprot:Trichotokara_eunicae@DN4451_c0_g1_i5.p1
MSRDSSSVVVVEGENQLSNSFGGNPLSHSLYYYDTFNGYFDPNEKYFYKSSLKVTSVSNPPRRGSLEEDSSTTTTIGTTIGGTTVEHEESFEDDSTERNIPFNDLPVFHNKKFTEYYSEANNRMATPPADVVKCGVQETEEVGERNKIDDETQKMSEKTETKNERRKRKKKRQRMLRSQGLISSDSKIEKTGKKKKKKKKKVLCVDT